MKFLIAIDFSVQLVSLQVLMQLIKNLTVNCIFPQTKSCETQSLKNVHFYQYYPFAIIHTIMYQYFIYLSSIFYFIYFFFSIWWPRRHSFSLFHIFFLGCPSRGSNSVPYSSTTRSTCELHHHPT